MFTDMEAGTRVQFRVYKKRFGWDEKVLDTTETTTVAGSTFSLATLWIPDEEGMYRLQVDAETPGGDALSSSNNEYFNISADDYCWIEYLVRSYFALNNLAGDRDEDGESNTAADVYLYLKEM